MGLADMMKKAVIWSFFLVLVSAQYRPKYPSPYLQREIFTLNLEDGYFGCQVNHSTDVLQLFELSNLCNGVPDCFLGSDEVGEDLKCTNKENCHPKMPRCMNGACLENLCYCNDGFGGKGCEMPDENECKYRPCDVFARCTNTMGSFYCSCFSGYEGDGFDCHDINECEIPTLAALCVENAECCNLPGHYVCKCLPGFTGNGTVSCTDINECLEPNSCGEGAQCQNNPGSYECRCPQGFTGDPYQLCQDVDECVISNPCGSRAICTNFIGGYQCSCPPGYHGDPTPNAGCVDVDECLDPDFHCGQLAGCINTPGSYYCQCPPGYTGDPRVECQDINECPYSCGVNTDCTNNPGSYECQCKSGYIGDPYASIGCKDEDECTNPNACGKNAECTNLLGSYECRCQFGYSGNPHMVCLDVDECEKHPCGNYSECINLPGSYKCECLEGYDGNANLVCKRIQVNVPCQENYECVENAHCVNRSCRCTEGYQALEIDCVDVNECGTPNFCGPNAFCVNSIGSYHCECKSGYEKISSTPGSHCRDVNECLLEIPPCGTSALCLNRNGSYECVCPDHLQGDPEVACVSPCAGIDCGSHAACRVNGREANCICDHGFTFDPTNITAGCIDVNECSNSHGPSGLCGQGAICTNALGSYQCVCPPGFTGDPFRYCEDINECDAKYGMSGQCGDRSMCENSIGSYSCSCYPGYTGNARLRCEDINECSEVFGANGRCGISAICTNTEGGFECRCPSGTAGDPFHECKVMIECVEDIDCPGNAICMSQHCFCPSPSFGNDCQHPCDEIFCVDNAKCELDLFGHPNCVCAPGYTGQSNSLAGCVDINECDASDTCGRDAVCRNIPGSYECICPQGLLGDPYIGCFPDSVGQGQGSCSDLTPCKPKEDCVTAGKTQKCVCKRGYIRNPVTGKCRDINECTEFRDKAPCGVDALCINMEGSYECLCPQGYKGNPYSVCLTHSIPCQKDSQCPGNTECIEDSFQTSHCGCRFPFVQEGKYCIKVSRNCSTTSPCPENQICVFTGVNYGFCICPRGYTVEADGYCRDIAECTEIREWSLCGPHAECINLPGSYECICDSGYTGNPKKECFFIEMFCNADNDCPEGQQCIQGQCTCMPPYVLNGQTCENPCNWKKCGQYASCVLSQREAVCECNKGFKGNPDERCLDVNECTSNLPVDPNGSCSVGATCINTIGSFVCECPPSSSGNPYEDGCQGETSCESNKDCTGNAVCEQKGRACIDPCSTFVCGQNAYCASENHKATCICHPGFSGDPYDETKGCVSSCTEVKCSQNAFCIVNSENQVVCVCQEGFTGNPWAGGHCYPDVRCSVNQTCSPSQDCMDGVCVERCNGIQCGVNAQCDRNTGHCVCPPFFTGHPAFLCVPPTSFPKCTPSCGTNAYCQYGTPNKCVCNTGYSGNPYEQCGPSQKCANTKCGLGAQCVTGPNGADCFCPAGLQGNPFLECLDVDECLLPPLPCGIGAACINTIGSFLCVCPSGTIGNPLLECSVQINECEDDSDCSENFLCQQDENGVKKCELVEPNECEDDAACSENFVCKQGETGIKRCEDVCQNVVCGHAANCTDGVCECNEGMTGDPNDLIEGCTYICQDDNCGPNALCNKNGHPPACECLSGFFGNPEDPKLGCQPPDICEDDNSCPANQLCKPDKNGVKNCFDVCERTRCGPNAECVGKDHKPVCLCLPGFSGTPTNLNKGCTSVPEDKCQKDDDCSETKLCQFTESGIKDCIDICAKRKCGPNSQCLGLGHTSICECFPGFSGIPDDLVHGCQRDICTTDSDCPASQACERESPQKVKNCTDVCKEKQCGPNAECVSFNHEAQCKCKPNFEGDGDNVIKGCKPVDKCKTNGECPDKDICKPNQNGIKDCISACLGTPCGPNTLCTVVRHRAHCTCENGYTGDPYKLDIGCTPIPPHLCDSNDACPPNAVCRPSSSGIRDCYDACAEIVCGPNAQCVSTDHKYVCTCTKGFIGDPNNHTHGCTVPHQCDSDEDCDSDKVCRMDSDKIRKCVLVCVYAECGVSAVCQAENHQPLCICPEGTIGDPNDAVNGCQTIPNICENDSNCIGDLVCRPNENGILDCLDACKFVSCGPNALCKPRNTEIVCVCEPDHEGDPYNLVNGCKPPIKDECEQDTDCASSQDLCKPDNSGIKKCVDACRFASCGTNSECVVIDHVHRCQCKPGFVKDPNNFLACIPKEPDQCKEDIQCPTFQTCKPNNLGTLKCATICLDFTCTPNSECIAINHKGQCQCKEGFTGDPNSRSGCVRVIPHECKTSNSCLSMSHECLPDAEGIRRCVDACNRVSCGPNAVCVTLNHKAECQCPTGLFIGDPYDSLHGCKEVDCLKDDQCDDNRACAPQHYCYDPCVNHCGVQAVCLVENHKAVCRCRPGYTGDPYLGGCESIKFCESAPCHPSAKCVHVSGSYKCHCPPGYLGDPYTTGCHHPNSCPNGDSDCSKDSACMDDLNEGFLCKNPCEQANCGPNSKCQVIDHRATCFCLDNFRGNPTPNDGCVRVSQPCLQVEECGSDNQACVSGQCRLFCTRDNDCAIGEKCVNNHCTIPCFSHSNCPSGEACITNGFCQLGCRENADCGQEMACIQNKCEDPCEIAGVCGSHAHCDVKNHEPSCSCPPGFEGNPSPVLGCKRVITVCSPVDSCPAPFICVRERCRPPCDKCVDGEKCIDNICLVSCTSDSNCPTGEICINQHCQVGCRNIADCHLNQICDSYNCICKAGFQRNASGCSDIDECSSNPCHPTAICENSPGTFYCSCRTGQIGDGFKGCYRPGECPNGDSDCPSNSACGQDENGIPKCVDPCSESSCGPNAGCVVYNHKHECFCPKTGLFTGNPYDKQKGCIKVDCLHDADCATDHHCLQFRCESPCTTVDCGPEGTCVVKNHQADCRCQPGFENNNHLSCIDIDECKLNPCHSSAICENVQGSYTCSCSPGLVGDPRISPGCHDPNICYNGNNDCLDTAACMLVEGVPYCKDPCDDPTSCGINATCKAVNHEAVCSCPFGFTGNPEVLCKKVECIKNRECHNNEVCLKNRCVDACLGQIICGKNTNCVSQDHSSICRCQDGYYGDPVAGCRKIITCVKDQDCPSGEFCYNENICRVACNSNRDCGLNELCHEEKCITVCRGNSDCPEGQACVDEKCINVDRCSSDTECEGIETCRSNNKGYDECQNSCTTVLCGRNAICVAEEHTAFCQCPPNFVGNPLDDYIGCQKAECIAHKHCQQDKVCHNSKCVDPCTLHQLCGENAYCVAESQAAVCRCRNGYEGDPLSGCQLIDHCVKRPCHPTANCGNRFGGYECQCPEDKNIGNPYNHPGCRGPNECPSGNIDCPPTATCVTNGLITPICKNPCQLSNICGRNAICKVEYHQPVCQCREQFSGDPNDPTHGCVRVLVACESDQECAAGFVCSNQRCRFPCESVQDCADGEFCIEDHCVQECQNDNECFTGEICIAQKCLVGCHTDADCTSKEACMQNKCRDSCESPTVCGTNAICTVENHNPQCKCLQGFMGDPQIECRRVLPNCTTSADCPLNHFCIRGQCLVECNTDGDCAVGEKCFNNHCVGLCRSDSVCQQNEICVSNRCEVGCRAGYHCPDHMACVRNQCRDPCEGSATCGPNAVCKVVNHRPACSCPSSFVGRPNANVGCIRVSTTCSDNSECPFGYYCFNKFCRVACSSDKDCVVNEKCSNGRCFIQCLQDRDCPSVEICKQNLCQVGCRSDSDCLFNEACINNQCLDPCGSPTVCGTNALCQVTNHFIECFCPPGLTGDAKIECNRVPTKCTNDNECGPDKYCDASMCAVACSTDTECLDNEKCIDRRCSVICTSDESCPGGYICETGQCIPGCRNDFECPIMDICISLQCINPCDSPTACGTNAQCQPVDHRPFCTCLPNYTGDPRVECNKVDCIIDSNCGASEICQNYKCIEGCRSDNSCPTDMTCIRRKCEDPCQFSAACGAHAICKTEVHNLLCSCPVGFSGNPLLECYRVGVCILSSDCDEGEVCEDNKCLPQVECRNNSECQLGEICLQNKCFEGCHTDDNCPFDQSCISGQCQNPCLVRGACGLKAVCSTVQHERICTCPQGFTGNPKTQCQEFTGTCSSENDCLAGTICQNGQCIVSKGCSSDNDCARGQICDNTTCVHGCRSDSDCEFDMACVGHQCQNPCSEEVCGTDAKCLAGNHQANCWCPEGYTGSAETHCYPLVEDCYADNDCELGKLCISNKCIVGCHANSHCPYDKACIEGRCQNPCQGRAACGVGAACRAVNHKAECTCPSNHTGDPKVRCTPFRPHQCEKESDCNSGFVCENNLCISVVQECSLDTACAPGKICEDNKCVVGCRRDSDCTFDKACIDSQCLNPCSGPNVCARNTNCRPVVHRPLCTCKPGFTGQPYVFCQQVSVSRVQCNVDKDCNTGKICEDHQCIVGCHKNSNCPTNKACINTKCKNPCDFPGACGLHATCVPNSHRPVCTCQVGYTGDANVICHPATIDLCASDRECSVGNICEEGNCIDACRTDDSCPYDKSCIENRCQDPCSFYSACGTQAFCHPANHKAVCSCPPSFIGDPNVLCIKGETDVPFCEFDTDCVFGSICIDESCVEGCRNDDHCSPDMACIGQRCENPCSPPDPCGINAQCSTDFHKPVCTCKLGFVGDPNEKCTFVDTNNCTTDTDCPIQHICDGSRCGIGCRSYKNCALEEACVNGICQNPCSVFGACGRSAICKPINHRPECFCPPNFHGNPNVICNRGYVDCNQDEDCELGKICDNKQCISGCRDDNNCPYNKICNSGQCLNPCLLPNTCGRNAECQPVNREVVCNCPKNMIGNPVIKCYPVVDSYCHNDTQCSIGNICENGKCIVGCRSDVNCAFEESCFNNLCQNPCTIFGACGENAECNPFNHDRICYCPLQFTGNPKIQCVRIPAVVHCSKDNDCLASQICEGGRCTDGCYSDNNCPQHKACIRGICANPCDQSGVCGKKALCFPFQHIPYCQCPSGFTGDPEVLCDEVVEDQCKEDENCAVGSICVQSQCIVGCRTNNNCPFNKACINTICQDPCLVGGACGVNTLCQSLKHEAVCSCLPGYTGSPLSECSVAQPVCEMDSDCGIGYVCVHQNCKDINECLQGHGPCAPGAVCTNLLGNYKCSCLSDLTGDPYFDGCRPVVTKCHRDTDCKSNEACDRKTEACYNLCSESGICGKRAKCKAINHQVECYCGTGLTGNPNLECSEIQTCVRHEECLGNLHCMGNRCNCPRPFKQEGFFCVLSSRNCSTTNPCPENQECIYISVQNSLCVCPRGFVMMPNGICRDLNECDQVPFPCGQGAQCFNSEGSYICKCPWGTIGEPNVGGCESTEGNCQIDEDCPLSQACDVTISKCHNPCLVENVCGLNAHCEVSNHSPQCLCPPGYTGNPNSSCQRIHGCQATENCPGNLICLPNKLCGCTEELSRIFDFCILTDRNCTTTSPCLKNQECVYTGTNEGFCMCPRGFSLQSDGSCIDINECVEQPQQPCSIGEYCRNTLGGYECRCPDGLRGDLHDGQCLRLRDGSGCQFDSDCLHSEVCETSSKTCYNPCGQDQMCGQNAICKTENHKPTCYCSPEYDGNPLTLCFKVIQCGVDYNCPGNQICLDTKTCGCPSQFQRMGEYCLLTSRNCTTSNPCPSNEECIYVGSHQGFCICPRGFRIMPNGNCHDINECEQSDSVCGKNGICINLPGSYQCTCPVDTIGDPYLSGCIDIIKKCKVNDECASDKECDRNSGECIVPCYICGPRSTCTVARHEAICVCPSNLIGDPYDKTYGCFNDVFGRTPAPSSDMSVMCLADGVQVSVHLDGFNGVLYVKGHSENPQCRRFVSNSDQQAVDFKVLFNTCGLIHVNGEASFILVIQKHPKLVTYRARAYHVKCVYNTGEKTISLGFNVSMITTSGTIANTGPPPSCKMTIVQANGKEITSAEVGDDLLLRVDVQPDYIYGGFARSCVAKTTDDNEEIEYQVTDDDGCATDPSVFGNWIIDPDTKLLEARFSAFKFPTSNNIRFQCNIRVCFGSCPLVNCNGVSTYQNRPKRQALYDKFILGENFQEGTLREEIQVQSNAILTLDPKSEKVFEFLDEPTISKIQNVCIPRLGFIISLVVTGLVALVAVAISISCWLMAYRKTSKPPNGPLPHPLDFPNPLHTSSEPIVAEPTPDYFPTPCNGF